MNARYSAINILKRGLFSGIVFTLLWSSWAYYINSSYGNDVAIRAAITQAGFTIINAFIYTVFMESMFSKGNSQLNRFVLAFILPNALVTIALVGIHIIRDTPNVSETVMPSLLVVYLLSLFYVLILGPKKLKEH